MVNHQSALKRIRQNEVARLRNKYDHKSVRTAVKKLKGDADKDSAASQYPKVASMIDKLVKKHIIHRNKAARLKSQLAKIVHQSAKADGE
ncbi:MAG: 30S ribosomal protein S20 [Flavobacteriales bacterium AspAUS03]